ncbi:DUF2959 family protein [uncultured Pseudomonas sp.]|uniref:DUF2959 family protein n=1 Tax=uncultured Pseudomonas sp. TaxID=114707 RepID=UPI0030D6F83F|tara:strand:+ start:185 stop:379 length:195 start_codon:yes stop_codon:yes gene_type:complete
MEGASVRKRGIMVDRVESVQKTQSDAKEQFESFLAQFRSIIQIKDQGLAECSRRLKNQGWGQSQ